MGILRKGIFDGLEGTTGLLLGRRVNGKNVISSARHKTSKPATEAQKAHLRNFALVMGLLKGFKELIGLGFKDKTGKKNSFNRAFKYNFNRVLTGCAPDYCLDFSKLVYSRGLLVGPNCATISLDSSVVLVSWLDDLQNRFNQYTDKATFAVYSPDKGFAFVYKDCAIRADLGCSLPLPDHLQAELLHVYMNFVSADGKVLGDSVYLGTI